MTDLKITSDGELMVAHVEALSEAGEEFVNAYMPETAKDLYVVDSGRIILPSGAMDVFRAAARDHALSCEEAASVYGG